MDSQQPDALTGPQVLYAPWRMSYIRSLSQPGGGAGGGGRPKDECFLCAAAAAETDADRWDRLVLWRTDLTVVLMNRFPYTNGHLLVAPRAHQPELDGLTDAEQADVARQTAAAVRLLRRAVAAQGFNLGVNLGRCAGAGVPGHLHQHVVPRWAGDINFMHVVGETRVVPEAMSQLYTELVRVRAEIGTG